MSRANLHFQTFPFSYEISRSRRKTLVIYVRSGKVEVRCPLQAPSTWIHAFLHEKTPWILQQLSLQRLKLRERLVIADNRLVPFFGKPRLIQVIISERQHVVLKGDKLYIFIQARNRDRLEKLFNAWLMEQAREYMTTQTIKYARELGVQDKLKDVVFRKTRSKWGHCCADGRIQYNWLIMLAPDAIIDYMICHETCHLLQMNHSAAYWRLVESVCPDYRQYVAWLKQHEHRLWPSQDAATA